MKLLFALACSLLIAAPVLADTGVEQQRRQQLTQPGNNAPVWRDVRAGKAHYTTDKGREAGVLVQSAGETWRQIRNGPVTFYGGWLLVLVAAAILAFYFTRGPLKLHGKPTGRRIARFGSFERFVHWSTAISFCVLGLSGLAMLFGKHVLLPVFGYGAFGWLAAASKGLHNFIAPLFIVSVLAMVLLFVKDNLFRRYDLQWLGRAWAVMARGEHVPTGRFNAGEKVWFWLGVVVLSVIVTWSGLVLLFPNFDQTRAVMQEAWIWHACAALAYVALSLGHIYLGTIGVEGSYEAMRSGSVDETWAKEHHALWYEETSGSKEKTWTRKPSTSAS
ncbi:MAG TPA: formate dehydrogenase subunit gamma [Steroidobacteraceae bacterium]|nr:formate dehydrogenase subunit gamma [Steroidobacteraceae bacterium]